MQARKQFLFDGVTSDDWLRLEYVRFDSTSKRVVVYCHRIRRPVAAVECVVWDAWQLLQKGAGLPDCLSTCDKQKHLAATFKSLMDVDHPVGVLGALKNKELPTPRFQRMALGICRHGDACIDEECTRRLMELRRTAALRLK